ncbi:NADH-quinone oxidoreductase subunit N [Oceanidesulfovibrio marinus]|uniref:NADH-quinone oxidoreductase subunit N n=1 Tax=Oceanidesulfovibrio marinus TaxID=370038 RepID=A0A6P1ZN93_9BACT|nr:NADH-quinone oxidoreductase subunit N [Oceanidesulfovibrio marinus]QJT10158.1 NADH-quinone oxidoreductase subunit N [Oceanidesulfovibrio marinus]TVM35728.1 NADH-quinone oxidoreductase subunit N [Oceanidesulfovibrio marinus]
MNPEYRLDLCWPELFQLGIIVLLFIQALAKGERPKNVNWVPYFAAGGIVVSVLSLGFTGTIFYGAYSVDKLSQFFKLAVAVGFAITSLNAVKPPDIEGDKRPDYMLFLAFSAFGLMVLASAVELITIYVALEISSYSVYALIPLRANDRHAAEGGIKYIMFGAVATAVALFGYAYVLAGAHSSYIADLQGLTLTFQAQPWVVVGLSLFLVGFLFKLALFPFHFWCPDVYEGTANETAAFAATLPKLGAAVVLVRFAALIVPGWPIATFLAVLGAVSMTFGNLAALAQRDVKRLLGYSSIAHAGYIMMGLVSGTAEGLAAASFYALVYVLMNLACFWVICRISHTGKNITLDDLDGLAQREPALAVVLAVGAFALVGLPPTAGFMGKLFLLQSLWDNGYNWLVIVAVLNTAIAIYYYLGLVRHAYTHEKDVPRNAVRASVSAQVWGTVLAIVLLVLGAAPAPVFDLAMQAGVALLP